MDLDFIEAMSKSRINNAYRKAKVRTGAVIDWLLANCNQKDFPHSLLFFLHKLTSEGMFFPDDLMTIFELHRLTLTKNGALKSPTFEMKQMIIAFFLIARVLWGLILLMPQSIGIGTEVTSNCK